MKVINNKDSFAQIESTFGILKRNTKSKELYKIADSLSDIFPEYKFIINIVDTKSKKPEDRFIMAVFPEKSVIDKIVNSMTTGLMGGSLILDLWEKNKLWTIYIDSKTIESNLTEAELTAILLHEVGHIAFDTSIIHRIHLLLSYKVATMKLSHKILLNFGSSIFRKIFSIPILKFCIDDSGKTKTSIREEIKADKFVIKLGYKKELESALTKIIQSQKKDKILDEYDKNIANIDMSDNLLNELISRRNRIDKNTFSLTRECTYGIPYVKSFIDDIEKDVCENEFGFIFTEDTEISDSLDDIESNMVDYICEMFGFTKELEKIDSGLTDYILVKINQIDSELDRMTVLSYIHSKIDLVNFYLSLYKSNFKFNNKKYKVPHTEQELVSIKKDLESLRKQAITKKIPDKTKKLLIRWSDGYEG